MYGLTCYSLQPMPEIYKTVATTAIIKNEKHATIISKTRPEKIIQ